MSDLILAARPSHCAKVISPNFLAYFFRDRAISKRRRGFLLLSFFLREKVFDAPRHDAGQIELSQWKTRRNSISIARARFSRRVRRNATRRHFIRRIAIFSTSEKDSLRLSRIELIPTIILHTLFLSLSSSLLLS